MSCIGLCCNISPQTTIKIGAYECTWFNRCLYMNMFQFLLKDRIILQKYEIDLKQNAVNIALH